MNRTAEIESAMDRLFGEGYTEHKEKERLWAEFRKQSETEIPDEEFHVFEKKTYPTIKKLKEL